MRAGARPSPGGPDPGGARRTRRRARGLMVVVALLIGTLGTVLPLPRFATERTMATETRRPLSEGATVQPAPPEPPVTDEGPLAPTSSSTTTTAPSSSTATTAPSTASTTTTPPAPDARVRVAEDTRDFDLIGVTLPSVPTTPVFVRTADDAGTWGEWHELEYEDADPRCAGPRGRRAARARRGHAGCTQRALLGGRRHPLRAGPGCVRRRGGQGPPGVRDDAPGGRRDAGGRGRPRRAGDLRA